MISVIKRSELLEIVVSPSRLVYHMPENNTLITAAAT